MADIRPFRGILYDTERVGGLGEVVGPPEDILSAEQAEAIVAGHPYHAVRLEIPDSGPDDCFTGAVDHFRDWLSRGVLVQSRRPAFYAHEHTFQFDGVERTRRGLFAALRLAEPEERIVLPHERTLPHQVELRTALLRDVRANLSPVYTLLADHGKMAATIARLVAGPPDIEGTDSERGHHRIWQVTQAAEIWALRDAVQHQPLYIADGHHRYAAAITYRNHLLSVGIEPGPAGWVLTYIADVSDPGILVLPIHRVVWSLGERPWETVLRCLERYFRISEYELPSGREDAQVALRDRLAQLGDEGGLPRYLIVAPGGAHLLQIELRDWRLVERFIPPGNAQAADHLDITVLDAVLLRRILGFDVEAIERLVEFTPDAQVAFEAVREGQAALAALVRPTPLHDLLAVARSGSRMPQKSTYFYPKIPIGLLMRDLRDVAEGDPDSV